MGGENDWFFTGWAGNLKPWKSSPGGKRHTRLPHVPNGCWLQESPLWFHIWQCHTHLFPWNSWTISFFWFSLLYLPFWFLLVYLILNMGTSLNSGLDLCSLSQHYSLTLFTSFHPRSAHFPSFLILLKFRSASCVALSFNLEILEVILDNFLSSITHGPLATKSYGFFLLNASQICFFHLCHPLSPVFYHYLTSSPSETVSTLPFSSSCISWYLSPHTFLFWSFLVSLSAIPSQVLYLNQLANLSPKNILLTSIRHLQKFCVCTHTHTHSEQPGNSTLVGLWRFFF